MSCRIPKAGCEVACDEMLTCSAACTGVEHRVFLFLSLLLDHCHHTPMSCTSVRSQSCGPGWQQTWQQTGGWTEEMLQLHHQNLGSCSVWHFPGIQPQPPAFS